MTMKPTYEELENKVRALEDRCAEHEKTENALRQNSLFYQALLDFAPVGIWHASVEGSGEYINPKGTEITGLTAESSRGDDWALAVHPDDRQRITNAWADFVTGKAPYHSTYRFKRPDNKVRWVIGQAVPVSGEKGVVSGYLGTLTDITDRKSLETALEKSEERCRAIIENLLDIYYRVDLEGKVVMVSPSAIGLLGYDSVEEVIGMNLAKDFYYRPEDREIFLRDLKERGKVEGYEITLKRKDGSPVVGETSSQFVHDGSGKPVAVEGIFRDMTERKRADQALQYRLNLEDMIASMSTRFINISPENLDNEIDRALQEIGEFTGVDRGYVFQYRSNRRIMDNTHEWCREGIEPHIENLQNLPVDDFHIVRNILRHSEVLHVPSIDSLPVDATRDREELQREGIKSLVAVPMLCGESLLGFLGLDSVREEKEWSGDIISLLTIVGEVFANALMRKRMEERLGERTRQLQVAHDQAVIYAEELNKEVIVRKRAQEALQKAHDVLEQRVAERTKELFSRNKQLEQEVTLRKQAEDALQESNEELKANTQTLVELNTALKVLLQHREEDKKQFEENILSHVKQLIMPYLVRLNNTRLNSDQSILLTVLETNLNNIIAPMAGNLSSKYRDLTPTEIRVADLVKDGKTNDEIAELLCISKNTVKFHRFNLRSKLGVKNKRINLRSHLMSLG
jgi:PAS domain S-box-containing protein